MDDIETIIKKLQTDEYFRQMFETKCKMNGLREYFLIEEEKEEEIKR